MNKINLVKEKIYEAKDKLERDITKLEKLQADKSILLAGEAVTGVKQEKKVELLTASCSLLKIAIEEQAPALIDGLEMTLAQLKEDKIIKDKKSLENKILGYEKSISVASEKFIPLLQEALILNKDIRDNWGLINKIFKETGKTKISGKYKLSSGSIQMLNFVCEILCREYNGKFVQRQTFYNNIRL